MGEFQETKASPPHYTGHRERLRERFRTAGDEAIADYELLELVLFRSIPRLDVKPLAKQLLATFGSFAEVIGASEARLKTVKGIGDATILDFKVVHAASRRIARSSVVKRTVLSSWSAAATRPLCRRTEDRDGPLRKDWST